MKETELEIWYGPWQGLQMAGKGQMFIYRSSESFR